MTSFKRPSRRPAVATLLLLVLLTWRAEATTAQLTASWIDNAADAVGISVEQSTSTTGAFTEIATTGPTATSYLDLTVAGGTTYCYRVRAYNPTAYWDVGLLAGILYNWRMVRTGSLADCIVAHAVTNGLLAAYVLYSGHWEY